MDEAIPALVGSLEAGEPPRMTVQAVVRAYLEVARDLERKRTDGRISPFARKLAAMAVGARIEHAGQSLQVVRQRFKTARALMDNPAAKWRCETRPGNVVVVERMPDGSAYYRAPLANPKVREIASMKPGETIVSKVLTATRGAGSLGSNCKVQARKALNAPKADWTVKAHGGKVRVTRLR